MLAHRCGRNPVHIKDSQVKTVKNTFIHLNFYVSFLQNWAVAFWGGFFKAYSKTSAENVQDQKTVMSDSLFWRPITCVSSDSLLWRTITCVSYDSLLWRTITCDSELIPIPGTQHRHLHQSPAATTSRALDREDHIGVKSRSAEEQCSLIHCSRHNLSKPTGKRTKLNKSAKQKLQSLNCWQQAKHAGLYSDPLQASKTEHRWRLWRLSQGDLHFCIRDSSARCRQKDTILWTPRGVVRKTLSFEPRAEERREIWHLDASSCRGVCVRRRMKVRTTVDNSWCWQRAAGQALLQLGTP